MCEDCGCRGDDIVSIRTHIETNHNNFVIGSDSLGSLEDFGIKKLPEITKRRKQDLRDLVMDENGDLVLDYDDKDEDFVSRDELLLIEEEDLGHIITSRRRKPTMKKRKVDEVVIPKKRQKQAETSNVLQCKQCNLSFTRKDNLSRHVRNKH